MKEQASRAAARESTYGAQKNNFLLIQNQFLVTNI
jgi:hypothetical protein